MVYILLTGPSMSLDRRLAIAGFPFLLACGMEATVPDPTSEQDQTEPPAEAATEADGDGRLAGGGAGGSTGEGGGELPLACAPMPACDGKGGPTLGPKRAFHHLGSKLLSAGGGANHRGRDLIAPAGADQWVIGKLAYGPLDKDLEGEDVDIYLERGCAGDWEKLGTATTTDDGQHATVEGVEDSGGRIYFQIPKAKALDVGRHRLRLVVAGDHTSADLLVDVVEKDAPIFVSDVDGTLTSSENAEYPALLTGKLPEANPDASTVLSQLAQKGARPVYLTARPEWLTTRTREFLAERGFPTGIVHTTTGATGALGDAAAKFKSSELAALRAKDLDIRWAFGNKASDTDAYESAKVQPLDHRIFLKLTDTHGGRRIEAYSELLAETKTAKAYCE